MSLPPNYNLLAKHPNKYYVETGSYRGDSLALALEAGFENIISIELFEEWINFCKQRFPKENRIKYIHGDSALVLWDVIKHINEPITFYLDSHSQLLEDEPQLANPFPLMKELAQINNHSIRTHTLLIDDILYLTHPDITNLSRLKLEYMIHQINSEYKIELIANPVKGNFLIASVK